MIHPIAAIPTAVRIMAKGVATPAPLPAAPAATTSGRIRAETNTGPMNPTDWATASRSDSLAFPSCSYSRVPAGCWPSTDPPFSAACRTLPRPAAVRALEPHVHLSGAHGGLVVGEL